jgi:lipid II:glycine glycyltransferase (peptidoglycan interpeptide bridge formation enzyme)
VRYYDLGGIDPEANPGVYHFKSGITENDVAHIPPFTLCESSLSGAMLQSAKLLRKAADGVRQRLAPAARRQD